MCSFILDCSRFNELVRAQCCDYIQETFIQFFFGGRNFLSIFAMTT